MTSVDVMKVRQNVASIINKTTLGVNVFLYLLFFVVIIAFNFENSGKAITCGNKYLSTPDTSVKKITTILYAVLQAFFSFALCIGLAFFGFKFVIQQWQRQKKLGVKSAQASSTKIFSVALVGGVAFLLHSLFILIQTALYQPKIIFNFIAIIVTEVIPSIYMYYNQFSFNQKIRRAKTMTSATAQNTKSGSYEPPPNSAAQQPDSNRLTFTNIEMSSRFTSN